jgi:hypothetical protein
LRTSENTSVENPITCFERELRIMLTEVEPYAGKAVYNERGTGERAMGFA